MVETTVPRERTARDKLRAAQKDLFPIQGIDYLELYVGNALQAAHYYRALWGYDITAYQGPETGHRDHVSYVLEQGRIRLVLTAPLQATGAIAEHVTRHGDGVKDIALRVPNVDHAYQVALSRGARGVMEPQESSDDQGTVKRAAIATYGDTIHSLIERDYHGPFLPGYRKREIKGHGVGLRVVDHIVGNVELGRMDEWVAFYANVMGFEQLVHFSDEQIATEYSALMSKVVQDGTGKIKFPINEPAQGKKKKSQIDEYLDYYNGPGAQHIAVATGDILDTVARLEANGVDFLHTPHTYYQDLPERIGQIKEDLEKLEAHSILADRDDDGYLLQIFSRPVEDRPTLFYELIERHGCRGFGEGNFKALFEAIEREQAERGNL
ncbi:MAG TPA: 4-hydroxyphenylpyruvate dioxygenase [Chloroflexia bacterium]|nr:4-hydroxyphenylpyruvate dioxygenase [Chloroflexia bacterium]